MTLTKEEVATLRSALALAIRVRLEAADVCQDERQKEHYETFVKQAQALLIKVRAS